jgi:hypothetical protein
MTPTDLLAHLELARRVEMLEPFARVPEPSPEAAPVRQDRVGQSEF